MKLTSKLLLKFLFNAILTLFLIDNVYANAWDSGYWDSVVQLGGLGYRVAESRIGVTSDETDTLRPTSSKASFVASIGIGRVISLCNGACTSNWFTNIEPAVNVYYFKGKGNGRIWLFGDPRFNDMSYKLNLKNTRLMFDLSVTVFDYQDFSLFAIGGIGPAWTNVGYRDYRDDEYGLERLHSSDVSTTFAGEAGGGISYALNPRVKLSLEYLYANIRHINVNASNGILVSNWAPAQLNMDTQAGLLGLHVVI